MLRLIVQGPGSMNRALGELYIKNVLLNESVQEPTFSKQDVMNLIAGMDLDDSQLKKLFSRVRNFTSYRPIQATMIKAGWNGLIVNRFSKEIQDLIEDIQSDRGKDAVEYFTKYIQGKTPGGLKSWPRHREGCLSETLAETGVDPVLISRIISHTSQDEGKRGVGMGEVAMSLLFSDIKSSKGKGDLAVENEEGKSSRVSLEGGEFEIKGWGATLGDKPESRNSPKLEPVKENGSGLIDLGITNIGKGDIGISYTIDGRHTEQAAHGDMARVLSELYLRSDEQRKWVEHFKNILLTHCGLNSPAFEKFFKQCDFTNEFSIQNLVAILNFVRYATKEKFNHFMAHDYGTKSYNKPTKKQISQAQVDGIDPSGLRGTEKSSSPTCEGRYVYVYGTPEQMATQLLDSNIGFEKIGSNNFRPRIGFNESGYIKVKQAFQ